MPYERAAGGYMAARKASKKVINFFVVGLTYGCPHITVTIPDTAVDTVGCYVEILNLSKVPYNTLEDGSKEYHKAVIKDFYMYDVNEENVIVRGVNPANTWLQICRVTDARLATDTKLLSNALYITDSGKMFVTDFNGNRINLIA